MRSSDSDGLETLRAAGIELRAGKSGKIRAARIPRELSCDDAVWRQLAALPDLVKLDAAGADVRDEHVELLADIPRLAQLDLSETGVTDASAAHLVRCRSLQLLNLTGTQIGAQTLKDLRQRLLETRIVFL